MFHYSCVLLPIKARNTLSLNVIEFLESSSSDPFEGALAFTLPSCFSTRRSLDTFLIKICNKFLFYLFILFLCVKASVSECSQGMESSREKAAGGSAAEQWSPLLGKSGTGGCVDSTEIPRMDESDAIKSNLLLEG